MIVDLQVNLDTREGVPADPEALISGAKSAGLDGILLTKDSSLTPDVSAYKAAGRTHGVAVFAGAKIPTNRGVILCILPDEGGELPDDFAERVEGIYDANAVIDAVEERGGVTVALRPYDRDVPRPMGDHLFSLQGLSACEVQNGQLSEIANDLALEAASNMEMPCIGTSCASGVEGLGTAATLFRIPVNSEAELCEAIRRGDCWPVTFSSEPPPAEAPSERAGSHDRGGGLGGEGGRRRGRRGGRRRREGGQGGGLERGNEGMRARGGGDRGPGAGAPRGPSGDRRGGGRRRSGGGGGGGGMMGGGRGGRGRGGQNRPDDIGNRVRGGGRDHPPDDNFGNIIPAGEQSLPSEDIGNRLRPGERSPYAPLRTPAFLDEEDDGGGHNR